ncbi:MAG: 3'-5' exonuclease [Pseudomonadota bacterium]
MHYMTFDIETVPDLASGRQLYGLEALDDEGAHAAMVALREQKAGTDFMPLHLHRVVAISVALRSGSDFKVWSLGDADAGEAEIVRRFFDGIDRFAPDLVTWNGSGFDLPVLHYRALLHGIDASRYWEVGEGEREWRFNNYLGRFHWRHIDLMDVLAGYQMRGRAPLDEIAVMLGFPGKLGMSGDKVWSAFNAGEIERIRNYCETDVVNTWLVFLRFEQMRGRIDAAGLERELTLVRSALKEAGGSHFEEYLAAWPEAANG